MKAIIFDLFETLVTEHGSVKYEKMQIAEDLLINKINFIHEWNKLQEKRYLGTYKNTESTINYILSVLNENVNPLLIKKVSKKRDTNKNKVFTNINPDIVKMLHSIKKNVYKIGLISNCSPEEIIGLKDCEIFQYFDTIILSCNVGFIKPDKRIYESCVRQLCAATPDCLYIGDGGSNELAGATQLGMNAIKAVWFTKEFNKNIDEDKEYKLLYHPRELIEYIQLY